MSAFTDDDQRLAQMHGYIACTTSTGQPCHNTTSQSIANYACNWMEQAEQGASGLQETAQNAGKKA